MLLTKVDAETIEKIADGIGVSVRWDYNGNGYYTPCLEITADTQANYDQFFPALRRANPSLASELVKYTSRDWYARGFGMSFPGVAGPDSPPPAPHDTREGTDPTWYGPGDPIPEEIAARKASGEGW